MTTTADVLAALQAVLEADPLIGLEGESAGHLLAVMPNVDWLTAKMPSAAILIAETTRAARIDDLEDVTATFEVRLAIDGGDGRGNMPTIVALAEEVRRVLIQNRRLASGNPLVGLIGASAPIGETYEVLGAAERGWLQTAIVRWRAQWLQSRTFDDATLVDARYVRTITLTPGVGISEDAPSIPTD